MSLFAPKMVTRPEHTEWFEFAGCVPGQPGVFEVDPVGVGPVVVGEQGRRVRRYAYWDGSRFSLPCASPQEAYDNRHNQDLFFEVALSQYPIHCFRGFTSEVFYA